MLFLSQPGITKVAAWEPLTSLLNTSGTSMMLQASPAAAWHPYAETDFSKKAVLTSRSALR